MPFTTAALGMALLSWQALVHAEVTILSSVQTIYDRSPKLRIKAIGLTADEHDISLTMVTFPLYCSRARGLRWLVIFCDFGIGLHLL